MQPLGAELSDVSQGLIRIEAPILPGTRQPEAETIGERIRTSIESLDLSEVQQGLVMTASVGVATLAEREVLHEWLQRADLAMFTAKHSGRNRVELAPASITEANAANLVSRRVTVRKTRVQAEEKEKD